MPIEKAIQMANNTFLEIFFQAVVSIFWCPNATPDASSHNVQFWANLDYLYFLVTYSMPQQL